MAERQLADLLVSIGLDRNVDIERIASELAVITLPGYLDKAAFQSSLLEAIESQLYRQTDERIRLLRQQLAAVPGMQGQVMTDEPRPAADQQDHDTLQESASEVHEPAPPPPPPSPIDQAPYEERDTTMVESEEIPEDATMIWKTRDKSF